MARDPNRAPPEVEDAARRRSEARAARDWETADRLRAEIEAAGWKVVDAGIAFRLEPASPPDVEVGGEIRYGRSDAVPSRLGDPATGIATVVVVASAVPGETLPALEALRRHAPSGVDLVVVADGLSDAAIADFRPPRGDHGGEDAGDPDTARAVELVRTSATLGHAAALNAGLRRARAPIVVVLDPSIVPTGDVITPLVRALDDPGVALAGPFGLASENLRQYDEVDGRSAGDAGSGSSSGTATAVAIQGYLQAFRRADYVARGPLDEAFRFYRNLDIWWSLVLRDQGEGERPRRALVVPDLPLSRGEPAAWRTTPVAVRDRLSKRNFYRVLDRFRTRLDLLA